MLQAHEALQSSVPLQALVPQVILQLPLPHSMPPEHALVAQLTVHAPEPQVILPLQALVLQVTVQALACEQSMSLPHWLVLQVVEQRQPAGQLQLCWRQSSSQTWPAQPLVHALGQLLVSTVVSTGSVVSLVVSGAAPSPSRAASSGRSPPASGDGPSTRPSPPSRDASPGASIPPSGAASACSRSAGKSAQQPGKKRVAPATIGRSHLINT
jgi:hypothetical protein